MEASKSDIAADKSDLVISYLTLRKAIGVLGISFPVILAFGACVFGDYGIQRSVSNYYHTNMQDVFAGILFAIALFLFSYRGYERKDNIAGDLACIFAIGVAIFPTTPDIAKPDWMPVIGILHLVFAMLLFLTLIYFSLFLFTKGKSVGKKKSRNRVYRWCGFIMLACILLVPVYHLFFKPGLDHLNPVFWLEAFALLAFGISWFTKGQAILKDD